MMETETKPRSHHRKRRERAHRLEPEPSDSELEGEQDGNEVSPAKGHKERSRSKPRKKKTVSSFEEDIIDGFAIVSFKSVEDLEKYTSGKLTNKSGGDKCYEKNKNHSLSPRHRKRHPITEIKRESKAVSRVNKAARRSSEIRPLNEEGSSGETTDNLDTATFNVPKKTVSRRYSDVSTRSSSGAGYLCDSESGDERNWCIGQQHWQHIVLQNTKPWP